ncbi:cbb3-type cytochrome c oxidase subunit 3 [Devosia sp.]|uniref:cbb3-type cytochrome c oxidase subunit 3 n=1 Tax=Devosia sp. TaxID=1871048 RepID=UPI00326378EB
MQHYDNLRHFADSWGLVYLLAIFLLAAAFIFRPGARERAREAALIPLSDADGMKGDHHDA